MKTKVIFRRHMGFYHNSAIAIFPDLPGTINPFTCLCYEHIGEHGSADLSFVMFSTRPAKGQDVEDLRQELTGRGYDLTEVKRVPRDSLKNRREAISDGKAWS